MTPEQYVPPPKQSSRGKKGPQQTEKPIVKGPVDGNAFAVMGAVILALKMAGQYAEVKAYTKKATSGDYDHLLRVSLEYVDFDLEGEEDER